MEVMRKAINLINGIDVNMSDEVVNEDKEENEDGEENEDVEESEEDEMNWSENGEDSETAGDRVRRNAFPRHLLRAGIDSAQTSVRSFMRISSTSS